MAETPKSIDPRDALIDNLQRQIDRLAGRFPAEPEAAPQYDDTYRLISPPVDDGRKTVYRAATKDDPPQVDHPGFISAIANNEDEVAQALANGWSLTYTADAKPSPKFSPAGKFPKAK